jgi:hypothetical protein
VAALSDYPELADACVCAAMRKTSDAPFAAPVQGFYSDHIRAGLDLAHRVRLHFSPAKQVNLALDKPAMQSSTSTWSWSDDPHADARGANNGILTGYYGFHTDFETQPWWQVDLSLVTPIRRIVVFNCLDGEMALRAAELFVLTSLDGRTWQEVYRRTDPQPFGGADGEPLQIVLPQPSLARYVRVALPGETYLHLDEVEVYAV